ncbi:hepatic lectin-like isoform X2 [Rana temporaria]|uniref:hepatic lectin-like isoform X2 n=1 Tax=Rana temporaria TaxID=8407 RepID=UPI001AACC211|nr:hepatic lectin-like isoform X2 [Rana temporaria]
MTDEIWTSADRSRRDRVIFILLGLLFLKFCVLLVFIGLLFALYSKMSQTSVRSCEQEWLEYENHCYFISTFQLTWQKAENMCLNRGGYLAIITSMEEQNFIEKNRDTGKSPLWFGLTDQETENTFKWVDGTTLTSFRYWDYGEPNNAFGIENCVQVWRQGQWNDEICNETSYAICEKHLY